MTLTQEQKQFYDDNGYLVVRGAFTLDELERLDGGFMRAVKSGKHLNNDKAYPAPGTLYTVEGQTQDDPDLLFIAEHPAVVGAVESLLGGPACLSAFVSYLKTPGAGGTGGDYQGSHPTGHCDYKTYQQAGSSLHWLFCIISLTHLDEETGPLLVSPGSHKLSKIIPVTENIHRVDRAQASDIAPLIDAQLRRGDLCFMHGFTWHEGKGNRSDHDRYGIYNKYRARNAPPGCGPQLFKEKSVRALSESGRALVPHHGDTPVVEARLIVVRKDNVLLVPNGGHGWKLPGTEAALEELKQPSVTAHIITHLEQALFESHGLDIPWMTYVADFQVAEGFRRVFAFVDTGDATAGSGFRWCSGEEIRTLAAAGELAAEDADAVHRWQTADYLRGIGQSPARAKQASSSHQVKRGAPS